MRRLLPNYQVASDKYKDNRSTCRGYLSFFFNRKDPLSYFPPRLRVAASAEQGKGEKTPSPVGEGKGWGSGILLDFLSKKLIGRIVNNLFCISLQSEFEINPKGPKEVI